MVAQTQRLASFMKSPTARGTVSPCGMVGKPPLGGSAPSPRRGQVSVTRPCQVTKCLVCANPYCNPCIWKMFMSYIPYTRVLTRRYHSKWKRRKPCAWGPYERQTSTKVKIRAVVRQAGDGVWGRCGFQPAGWGEQILLERNQETQPFITKPHNGPSTQTLSTLRHPAIGRRDAFLGTCWGGWGLLRDEWDTAPVVGKWAREETLVTSETSLSGRGPKCLLYQTHKTGKIV